MKNYLVMYIIRPNLEEEANKALQEEVAKIFTDNGGSVEAVPGWGLRDLAYEIDGETKGFYVTLKVSANVEAINEFERVANIKETIIRHIVTLA